MKTFVVVTPGNIEVEYRLAGLGSRLGAFLVDFFVQMVMTVVGAVVVLWFFDRVIFGNVSNPSGEALGIWMVFAFLVQFGYFVVCEMALNGQSVGKRIFGLRVIRENGQPIEFWQSLVRGLFRTLLDMMYIGVFFIMLSPKHKRLGDMAAGTIVVSEHYNEEADPALFSEQPYWPNFLPEPFLLTPEERQITEEWLARRDYLPDGGATVGNKIVEYLKKYQNPVEIEPLVAEPLMEEFFQEMPEEASGVDIFNALQNLEEENEHESISNQWQPPEDGEYGRDVEHGT